MFKTFLDKLLFIYSRFSTIIVMAIVALIMYFSFYIYFGFEELVGICFMYIFPICICLQSITLIFTEGNNLLPCISTLIFYGVVFTIVLDSSCLFYLIPYSVLYIIMYFILRLFNSIRKHKVEDSDDSEDMLFQYNDFESKSRMCEDSSEDDNDLWLDF